MAIKYLNLPEWNTRIDKEYPILHDKNAYDSMYQDYGKKFKEDVESGRLNVGVQPYTRVHIAMQEMGKPKKVLDYACGIGNEAILFVNAFGCKVTSINISEEEMSIGKKLAEKHCKHPEKITWVCADTPDVVKDSDFDVVFAGEILEHMAEPQKLVDSLEGKCKTGGRMVFTVPFGPWGDVDIDLQQRGHLWNFEQQDIKDIFGQKKDMRSMAVGGTPNEKNLELLGWNVISYTKSKATTGKVNLDRKVAIQAPRQTVSACMIIGGEQEGLLHRCLKSIYPIVDEIIVADTGMSVESLEILKNHKYSSKVKIIADAPNPLEVGFDEARNESIKHANCDWILWIDSDEELVDNAKIFKYLRHNPFNGYSIKQHHFSVQPPNAFRADLPVRVFRNNIGMKFYGVIHEHPEIELNEGAGMSTVMGDVNIAHDGYLSEDRRRKRFMRNFNLMCRDREKYPERVLGKFLMMRDQIHLVRYSMEQNGGQVTQEVAGWCEEVIKTYKEEFLGKDLMMSHDGLGFYSEALTVLGRGMEYCFNLDIKPVDTRITEDDIRARFENDEDFITYIGSKVEMIKEPFEGRYV